VTPWQDGFIAGDGAHTWRSVNGRSWVPLDRTRGSGSGGRVLVGDSQGLYWSSDGATWTAATGPPVESYDSVDHRQRRAESAIALNVQNEMWITTDGRTWRTRAQS